MHRSRRHAARLAAARLAAALLAATGLACDRSSSGSADSTFASDLALAGADTTAQPALQDVAPPPPVIAPDPGALRVEAPGARPPAAGAPPAPGPRPTPPSASAEPAPAPEGNVESAGGEGGGAIGTVPAGSAVRLAAGQRICTSSSRAGDRFTATVTEAVRGSNGAQIPAGSTIVLEATQMRRGANARERPVMGFAVVSLIVEGVTYPVRGEVTEVQVEGASADGAGNAMRKVATGAAIGAILGQITGRDTRSTVGGAAAGAVLGAGAAIVTANFDGCVPGGGRVDVRITEPLQIRVAA